jgi:hypothetical protein
MALPGGLGTQLGISASESSFGTYTTPTRFLEYVSETMKYNKTVTQGMGLRAGGSFARSARRVITQTDASGDIQIEMATRGLGLLLAHATGTYASPTGSGPYVYVFTPGDQGPTSFTCQIGEPQYGGTVTPKNLLGCKITDWNMSIAAGGILDGKFTITAAGYENSTAMATASYPATYQVFHFAQGVLKIDGTAVANIRDWNLNVNNNLNTGRVNLGSSGKIANQIHNGFRSGTGTITAEFTDTTLTAKVLADSVTSIEMIFTSGASILSILTPVAFFNDGNPMISGPGDIDIPLNFDILDDGTNAPYTITYTTPDSTL